MRATFDVIATAKKALNDLDAPAAALAHLSGISGSRLSKYFAGHLSIGGEDEQKLRRATENLRRFVEFAKPIPVSFGDVEKLKQAIDSMNEGRLQVVMLDLGDK